MECHPEAIAALGTEEAKNRMSDAQKEDALARAISAGLPPQSFPFRREVEFAGIRHDSSERICFYDTWWPEDTTVCFAAASLSSGGIEGALAAASLKHLLRAAIAELTEPGAALAACRHLIGADTGVTVATLDLQSGTTRAAALGDAAFGYDTSPTTGCATVALQPGAYLWIAAGTLPSPRIAEAGAGMSAAEALDAAGAGLQPGGVLGLIFFKGRSRRPDDSMSETISITNENRQIASAILQMEKFRERCGIDENTFAGLDLAVDELLTNLVSYAFRDGACHRIDIDLDFSGKRLCIDIRDDGVPFNPLDIPPPNLDGELGEREVGGLGMHFVRNIADEITYRREANWNILRLTKNMGVPQGTGEAAHERGSLGR
jgi:anti-sigma regulatory factor (Ser/Thr protein kinase)